ncbi:alpha-ketoacid dehydrogenase subunit alpha/beta [Steroidobacter agaridevorans]|uniref:alpha-ketoacid dehydrogenase subunit alpha/beta n=1 Tax=Steroidobacter agaridevorans TaxID=2695856 RepID=UPI00132A45D6|nr:dehydrogenase E1 component subunit alpha/beta [Steroidobacter agaridevorans]GFE88874.1 2-oxoisovalerate dehydrogenase E1 [Steroidobacter agaridevorans]
MPGYDRKFLLDMYERMVLIREFEDTVKFLFLEGTMPGTIHQCQGQEATAVGVCTALSSDDWITSTFRGHGHALAKGLAPQELMDELFGAETGCCKGRGGSMHVGNMSKGMVPGIAIVAGGIPLAAGMALSFKLENKPHVVASFFGDGAIAEGAFHEGVNMAAIWNLPLILVCENNLYGASTHVDLVMKNSRISDRAKSYGFRGETVDGNDVLAVYEAAQKAVAECRAGHGPVLLELMTYRRTGHSRRDPCHYQPKDEREAWAQRDPIERFAAKVQITAEEHELINTRIQKTLTAAVERAKVAPHPSASDLTDYVFAEASPRPSALNEQLNPVVSAGGSTRRLGIAEALREGITEEMAADPRVFCIGEDIGVPGGWGGAFTVTLGLEKRFPERMINTPIAELGFFGLATGAAVMGMRPIADVQYGDFLFLASDQIINNAAKLRYMSGGTISVPLVMRAPVGATGRGSQHAQNMERYFTGVPGLKVVAPSNAYDAKGLLKAALRDGNPVLMFEHKLLYGSKGARAEGGAVDASSDVPLEDYVVPIGKAAVRREGKRVTVLAWLLMVHYAMQVADELDAEVIDVRSLSPIDWETIGASVRKTGHAVIVEEGPVTGGVGAEIAAGIAERWPSVRVTRVASPDVPVPFTPVLENAYRPNADCISMGVREILEESHG